MSLKTLLSPKNNAADRDDEKYLQPEELCLRMHNNTAFMGVEPFARLRLYSASDCRKNCLEAYPKCVGGLLCDRYQTIRMMRGIEIISVNDCYGFMAMHECLLSV